MAVVIDGEFKRVEEVVRVSLGEEVIISEAARSRIGKSREAVEDIVREGKRIYGVTTGFGKFADVAISLMTYGLFRRIWWSATRSEPVRSSANRR